ncbi:hypothetical protein Tdes44962_MAKER09902 [Teratosphaeria destructans]|uniref:Uncharacterized protein n=1 Tax=Teratosphaeria destructans TaxID=418781 RepID=A0A9W7W209_9PEZI|nr:hypothetical protein Tdes44962_MAKER09902 [Teratosphaeria destructans]
MANTYAVFRRQLTACLEALSPQSRRHHQQLPKPSQPPPSPSTEMPQMRPTQRHADRAAAGADTIRPRSRRGDGAEGGLVQLPDGKVSGQVDQDGQAEPSASGGKRMAPDDADTPSDHAVASASSRMKRKSHDDELAASGDDRPPRKKRRPTSWQADEAEEAAQPAASGRKRKRKVVHEEESDLGDDSEAPEGDRPRRIPRASRGPAPRPGGQGSKTTREVTHIIVPTREAPHTSRRPARAAAGKGSPECPPDAVVYNVVYTQDGSTADAGDDQSGRADFETRLEVLGTFTNLRLANKLVRATVKGWQREKQAQGSSFERIECAEEAWDKTVESLHDDDQVVCMFGRRRDSRIWCVTQDETYGERRVGVQVATVKGEPTEAEDGPSQETDDSQFPTPPNSTPTRHSDVGSARPPTRGNTGCVLDPARPGFIYNVYRKMVNHRSGEDEFRTFGAYLDQSEANALCWSMAREAHPKLAPSEEEEGEMEVQEAEELWPTPHRVSALEAFRSRGGEMIYAVEDELGRFADWWAVERVKLQ